MDCLLFVLGQRAVFALDLWCVLLRRGFSFGANGFVHDFFRRREYSVSGARFRALLASLFFSRLHLAAGVLGASSGFLFLDRSAQFPGWLWSCATGKRR